VFATPTGRTRRADPKMVTGEGLGILSPLLKADANGRSAYLYMEQSDAFQRPISYGEIRAEDFDALLLPGGHAPGMRVYLGSGVLQSAVADFFAQEKPVGAICHGVLLAARSSLHPGKSVLYGKKTTALTNRWNLSPGG
jgi:putative intracellular protease/amidase